MTVTTALRGFSPIDLTELDRLAALRTRFDLKYAVDENVVDRLLDELPRSWRVLDIQGAREFGYASLYFDDPDHRCFHDHRRRLRRRFKVRSRGYETRTGAMLELKTKDGRGRTVKQRLTRPEPRAALTPPECDWIDQRLAEIGLAPTARDLRPVLTIEYRRSTLVEPSLGERLTIDLGIASVAHGDPTALLPRAAIVEWKSGGEQGDTARLLRRLGPRPIGFSKYCVGLSTSVSSYGSRSRREADRDLDRQRR